jgi:hypothetical protein
MMFRMGVSGTSWSRHTASRWPADAVSPSLRRGRLNASATGEKLAPVANLDRLPDDLDLAASSGPPMPLDCRAPNFSPNTRHGPIDWLYPLSGLSLRHRRSHRHRCRIFADAAADTPLRRASSHDSGNRFALRPAVTNTAGTAITPRTANVDWRVAGLSAAGSVPAAVLTVGGSYPRCGSRARPQPALYPSGGADHRGRSHLLSARICRSHLLSARIWDYALARADKPARTRYSGPITVVFGSPEGCERTDRQHAGRHQRHFSRPEDRPGPSR